MSLSRAAARDRRPHGGCDTGSGPASKRSTESDRLLESLHDELGAPVALFDPATHTWRGIRGGPEGAFPKIDDQLRELAGCSGLRAGRVGLWRRRESPGVVWLVLPLATTNDCELVAFAGFHAMTEPPASESGASSPGRQGGAEVSWGPPCPDPALRAWGQQLVNRLQNDEETRLYPLASLPPAEADSEAEHVVIGRLIRRMRISDPPRSFQGLATNVLKTSLGMEAVAWVPGEMHEPVVVSGEVDGLGSNDYRQLLPDGLRETTTLAVDTRIDPGPWPPGIRQFAAVAAGSSGWLVAINPTPARNISVGEIERIQYVASLIATQASNGRIYIELKELLFGIIRALTAAIDAKDPYTSGHSERVARIAVRLAEELGMPPQKRSDLYLAGLLHDVGKIGIDDQVLKKCGPLTPEEYRAIQAHVEIGVTILHDLRKLHHILPGVRHHHESMDGTGYPDRLTGEQIPFEARILAVADSFDAMSSNRPYRKRLSPLQIDEIFRKGKGQQWDPKVVDALFACRAELEAIRQKGLGESLIGAVNVTLGRG